MSVVDCPENAALAFACDRDYWTNLIPDFNITDHPIQNAASRYQVDVPDMGAPVRQVIKEGYTQLPSVIPRVETTRLAECVKKICDLSLPPVFAFVYDEFWQMFANLSGALNPIIGSGYRMKPADIWIWYVDREKAGWAPHRDMINSRTLHPDGRPANLTVWIPLTDVSPLNGCMYVLPTNRDRHLPRWLIRTSVKLKDLQNVRALPAKAGSVLCWNSRILHWGSRSSEWADQPRISVAVYLQSSDYEKFGLNGDFASNETLLLNAETELTFENRLDAIRGAIRMYGSRIVKEYPKVADSLLAFANVNQPPVSRFSWTYLRSLLSL